MSGGEKVSFTSSSFVRAQPEAERDKLRTSGQEGGRPAQSSIRSALADATRRLAGTGSESARLDALLLLGHATGWSKAELLAHPERVVGPSAAAAFEGLVARRLVGEPVAYLLGTREFYGRDFRVDRRALIPRPETEMLVEIGISAVRGWLDRGVAPRVVDVGTGTGAIAVTVAAETGVPVVALDRSAAALSLARENAERLARASRVWLVQGDLVTALLGPIHVLLANLPYIPSGRVLPRDVADYEPLDALSAGPTGAEVVLELLAQAAPLLAPRGDVACEIDEGQGPAVAEAASSQFPGSAVEVRRDGASLERLLLVRLAA